MGWLYLDLCVLVCGRLENRLLLCIVKTHAFFNTFVLCAGHHATSTCEIDYQSRAPCLFNLGIFKCEY